MQDLRVQPHIHLNHAYPYSSAASGQRPNLTTDSQSASLSNQLINSCFTLRICARCVSFLGKSQARPLWLEHFSWLYADQKPFRSMARRSPPLLRNSERSNKQAPRPTCHSSHRLLLVRLDHGWRSSPSTKETRVYSVGSISMGRLRFPRDSASICLTSIAKRGE